MYFICCCQYQLAWRCVAEPWSWRWPFASLVLRNSTIDDNGHGVVTRHYNQPTNEWLDVFQRFRWETIRLYGLALADNRCVRLAAILRIVALPPTRERSIVMSARARACVCVCMFVCPRSYIWNYMSDLHRVFLRVLPMAVARSSSGGVMLLYVLPVLWMTFIFAHKPRLARRRRPAQLKRSAHAVFGLAINCAQQYQLQANGCTGLLFGRLK